MDGSVSGATRPGFKLKITKKADSPLVAGRRRFFKYRDLGVADATGGELRAQVMEAVTGMTEPTGWHVHHCQAQFIYVLKGWVTLEFEDGSKHRMEAGDSGLIPARSSTTRSPPRTTWRSSSSRSPGRWAPRPASRRPAWGERSDGWSAPGREGLNRTARRSDDRSALGHEGLKRTALHPRRRAAAAAPDDPCRRGNDE